MPNSLMSRYYEKRIETYTSGICEVENKLVVQRFKTKSTAENRLVLIGNHWPSPRGGQYELEPYRMVARETPSDFHQLIQEENYEEKR